MTTPGPFTFTYDGQWRQNAACRGKDTNLFFPERGEHNTEAVEICNGCPVRTICLEQGLVNYELGVWGGTSERERRVLVRRRKIDGTIGNRARPRPACGTDAGHRYHLRKHEPPCAECLHAHKQSKRALDERRDPELRSQCGTNAGYMAHHRAQPQERPCQPCITARGIYEARRKNQAS